ncbi:binding partner of ACD11 1 isoform X2 [Nicotiana tabacum]|uniref:Binding partner of ACD11 1 isoform X2 n=1 Tax=Nicotiana tabacum TaxID=4097 RepID=A0A1S4DK36_TOBAC|nr:PREDICTED: binding partner of ACD11 1-like isoform X2 [Nicotiana tabacum]
MLRCKVILNEAKLHMLHSRILRELTLQFFFQLADFISFQIFSCKFLYKGSKFLIWHKLYLKQRKRVSVGATIVDMSVTVTLDPVYQLSPGAATAPPPTGKKTAGDSESAFQKAEDVSSMLAKGYILGKDAVGKAKSFDEKHQLTSSASAKVASLNQKIGLTEKISIGTSIVNEKVREVDQKLQVSEKAKSAFAVVEQNVSSAGSAITKNRYVLTGATWVTCAFSKVAKTAGEVGQKTKEKVGMTEDEQRQKMVTDFAQVHLSDSPKASNFTEHQSSKPAAVQGLVL